MAAERIASGPPEEPHGVSEPMPHHEVPYVMIFLILIVLTVVTVAVTLIHLESHIARFLVALLIASLKGACVALYFMHLKFEGKLIYLILIVPLILTVILVAALIPDSRPGVIFGTELAQPAAEVTRPPDATP